MPLGIVAKSIDTLSRSERKYANGDKVRCGDVWVMAGTARLAAYTCSDIQACEAGDCHAMSEAHNYVEAHGQRFMPLAYFVRIV